MKRTRVAAITGVALVVVIATSCEDDNPPIPMVTISGIVRNVDTRANAQGVRVRLYGTNYMDVAPTGSDGAYALQVPRGSKLQLFTDDFDPATADAWFPLVNVDQPHIYANEDMLDWPIHSCPQSACPELLSVAVMDNYLQNADAANGDRFVPTSAAASGGILSLLCFQVNGDTVSAISGAKIVSNTPAFPEGYINDAVASDPDRACDPNSSIMHPGTWPSVEVMSVSFGDPAYSAGSVSLTITDTNVSRNYVFAGPWDVPVAPGMITLGWIVAVDGVPNKTFREFACSAAWFTCAPKASLERPRVRRPGPFAVGF